MYILFLCDRIFSLYWEKKENVNLQPGGADQNLQQWKPMRFSSLLCKFMYKINLRGPGEQLGFLKNLMDEQIT